VELVDTLIQINSFGVPVSIPAIEVQNRTQVLVFIDLGQTPNLAPKLQTPNSNSKLQTPKLQTPNSKLPNSNSKLKLKLQTLCKNHSSVISKRAFKR
jgi:hypothetical protein